ncbi:MAG TPA: glycosyltransferase [Longimicrobiaceae bacterium]|nr:glycosyltransferase [Longimicrobiaceae bacterium]
MTLPIAREPDSSRLPDLVCLSHLRWDFVYQRPQHLLSRFARERRVFFFEEALFDTDTPYLQVERREDGLHVAVPHLVWGAWDDVDRVQGELLDGLLREHGIRDYLLWYYTPIPVAFTGHLEPLATVYDCMDELSAFKGATPVMVEREAELLRRADLVFTGGQSLYEAKRDRHPRVFAFPSSIDAAHFAQARERSGEDAVPAARPQLGYYGVIDERMDLELLAGVAGARPDWDLVMVGPVMKIEEADIPRLPNLHFPGGAEYARLPELVAGWDVALIPFAINESTRFISPTKTPEYLAAGKPVVSTPIRDVVRPYGDQGLVRIAGTVPEFVAAVEAALAEDADTRAAWLERVDALLAGTSWDRTWRAMDRLVEGATPGWNGAEDDDELAAD